MRLRALAFTVLAAALASSAPSQAAVMVATWSTTIQQVRQPDELVPGPDLVGEAFQIKLTYDTELGDLYEQEKDGRPYSFLLEGLLSAAVSYGDEPFSNIDLTGYSSEQKYGLGDTGPFGYSSLSTQIPGGGFLAFDLLTSRADRASHDLTQPFATAFEGEGLFIVVTPDFEFQLDLASTDGKPGWLTVERQAAAVPEPATWALMISGFGMAGAALRRRRAVPA